MGAPCRLVMGLAAHDAHGERRPIAPVSAPRLRLDDLEDDGEPTTLEELHAVLVAELGEPARRIIGGCKVPSVVVARTEFVERAVSLGYGPLAIGRYLQMSRKSVWNRRTHAPVIRPDSARVRR